MWNRITNQLKIIWSIFKVSVKKWNDRDPFRQSAVIAYYTLFSLPALLVIIITSAGFIFGEEAVRGEISSQIGSMIGTDTARQVEEMIAKASETKSSVIATSIGIVALLFGATGVFAQLQKSLNMVWEVKPKPKQPFFKLLRVRLFSFGLILSIGFLLLVSLVISSALSVLSEWIRTYFPDILLFLVRFLNFVVSLGIIAVLFALMFKFLPDAKMRWKDVWYGAFITSLLFITGKFLISLYFGKADPGSTYGAAGSVVLILLWVSYSSMLVFLGAEFTKEYAKKYGEGIEPSSTAVRTDADDCAKKKQEPDEDQPDTPGKAA